MCLRLQEKIICDEYGAVLKKKHVLSMCGNLSFCDEEIADFIRCR